MNTLVGDPIVIPIVKDADVDETNTILVPTAEAATHIIFWSIEPDDICSNPLEDCDGMGHIISLCCNHVNFNSDTFDVRHEDPDCVVLGYFEHGMCDWHVSGHMPAGTEGDYRWDGVSIAGLWMPDHCCLEDLKGIKDKAKRRARAVELATQACKVYTSYCNGECYYFSFKMYEIRKHEDGDIFDDPDDYRYDDPLIEDSCGGFLGYDDIEYILSDHINPLIRDAYKDIYEKSDNN